MTLYVYGDDVSHCVAWCVYGIGEASGGHCDCDGITTAANKKTEAWWTAGMVKYSKRVLLR